MDFPINHSQAYKFSSRLVKYGALSLSFFAIILSGLNLSLPFLEVSHCPIILITVLKGKAVSADFAEVCRNRTFNNTSVSVLLEHIELAQIQKQQFYFEIDSNQYSEYILSPIIDPISNNNLQWRRILWEYVYPRIRKEHDPATAAVMIARYLRQRVGVRASISGDPFDIKHTWQTGFTTGEGFEMLYVAALRSVGIAARLDSSRRAEFWNRSHWEQAPRPVIESSSFMN